MKVEFDIKADVRVDLHMHQTLPADLQAAIRLIPGMKQILSDVNSRSISIMATQQEAAAILQSTADELAATKAIVEKVGVETDGLLAKIQVLTDAAAAAGNVGTELQAAIDGVVTQSAAVKAAAQADDDKVVDEPPAP
jgi:ABC-type transporter Mla subunit MlaD